MKPLYTILGFLLLISSVSADLFAPIDLYPEDDKAILISAADFNKIADVELYNDVKKVATTSLKNDVVVQEDRLYIQDCGMFKCDVIVDFKPTTDWTVGFTDFRGIVYGSENVQFIGVSVLTLAEVEVDKPVYETQTITEEVCGLNNATMLNECWNETYETQVQVGTETETQVSESWGVVEPGTILKGGQAYKLKYSYKRTDVYAVADLIPVVAKAEMKGWAWWNSTWESYREINITDTDFDGSAVYFNITFPTNISGEARFTTNSTGTETECGGWWKVENQTNEMWILNCTLANGTTSIRGYYNNNTAVSDLRNINESCKFADDFEASAIDTNKWDKLSQGTFGSVIENGKLKIRAKDYVHTKTFTTGRNSTWITYVKTPLNTGGSSAASYWGLILASPLHQITQGQSLNVYGTTDFWGRTYTGSGYNVNSGVNWTDEFHFFEGIYTAGRMEFLVDGNSNVSTTYVSTSDSMIYRIGESYYSANYLYTEYVCIIDTLGNYGINATFSAWSDEINNTSTEAPAIQSLNLTPATLYKNTTDLECSMNWTHSTNSTFEVYSGLAVNGSIIDAYNTTNLTYANGTLLVIPHADISDYTHGDNISCWSYAIADDEDNTTSATNYSTEITMGNYPPDISNVQITDPLQYNQDAIGSADFSDLEGDVINCNWEWFVNGSSTHNDTQTPCLNTSTFAQGNYSTGDFINFTLTANDSIDNSTSVNSATVEVMQEFLVNSYSIGGATHYEGLTYNYTINFTVMPNRTINTVFNYNAQNLTPSCSNVSTTYFCEINDLMEPPIVLNSTTQTGIWFVSINNGTNTSILNQTFALTSLWGVWPTNITSTEQVAMRNTGQINVSYGSVAGFGLVLTGASYLGSTTNLLTCAAGLCTSTFTAQDVSAAQAFQANANLTIISPFWGTSVSREVNIYEEGGQTGADATKTSTGSWSNLANAYDLNWGTYATAPNTGTLTSTYAFPRMVNITNWRVKDWGATRDITVPDGCLGSEVIFRVQESNTIVGFIYSCYNYETEDYEPITTTAAITYSRFYEQNLTYISNNSLTRIVPFGLNLCTMGIPIMHFQTQEEETFGSLTVNYSQTFFLTVGNTTTGYLFSDTDDDWEICMYPASLNGTITSYETYEATGYPIRSYIITDGTTTPTNYTRYLGFGSAIGYTFNILTQYSTAIDEAYIEITKFNPNTNTWVIVSNAKTDYTGSIGLNLIPYSYYKVNVSKTGYVDKLFDFTPTTIYYIDIYMSPLSYLISSLPASNWVLNDVVISFTPTNQSFFNNNTNITFGIASNSSRLEYYGMRITREYNGTTTEVFFSNVSSNVGGILNYTTNGTGYYRAKAWWKHLDYPLYDPALMLFIGDSTGIAYARDLFAGLMHPFTFYLLAILITAVAVGFISQYAGDGAGIIGLVILWGFTLLNPNVEMFCIIGEHCITPVIATILTTVVVIGGFYAKQYI